MGSRGRGGIRRNNPPEVPGSIPYVHGPDARAAFNSFARACTSASST